MSSYNYHLIGAKLIKNLISSDKSLSENCILRANQLKDNEINLIEESLCKPKIIAQTKSVL